MPDIGDQDLSKVQPRDYLRDGFYDGRGRLREGISGFYSLALAYHLRKEEVAPDSLNEVLEQLQKIADEHGPQFETKPHTEPVPAANSALQSLAKHKTVAGSPALSAVFKAAKPWTKNWKGFSALVLHLDRTHSQLALIAAMNETRPLPGQKP